MNSILKEAMKIGVKGDMREYETYKKRLKESVKDPKILRACLDMLPGILKV